MAPRQVKAMRDAGMPVIYVRIGWALRALRPWAVQMSSTEEI
jgi:hypothetical protein